MRHSSSQDLSANQEGAGLGILFSKPTPPVRKNMNSSRSNSRLALRSGEEGRRRGGGGEEEGHRRTKEREEGGRKNKGGRRTRGGGREREEGDGGRMVDRERRRWR